MLHLYSAKPSAKPEQTKENTNATSANKSSYANPDSNLFPQYKHKQSAVTNIGGSGNTGMGYTAAALTSKLVKSGAGRSTSNFDKKIAAKEEKGNMAGAARAERREAKWDHRQNKKAKKISAKTEGTYQPEKKESKDAREDFKRTGTASELKENQLRRANAAKEETTPTGDTGSNVVGVTNTGTGGFGKTAASGFNSSNYTDFGKEYIPEKPVFNNKTRFKKIQPNVNSNDPGEGGKTPTKVLTDQTTGDYSREAVEGRISSAAKLAHERKFTKVTGLANIKQFYAKVAAGVAAEKVKQKYYDKLRKNAQLF